MAAVQEEAEKSQGQHRKLERVKEGFSPTISAQTRPCLHLNLGLVASRTARQYISVVVGHLVCSTCYSNPEILIYTRRHSFSVVKVQPPIPGTT